MQPWAQGGCIFQNGFLGEVQFKIPQKVDFSTKKVGLYSIKTPKTGLFTLPGALLKSGIALAWIR